MAYQIGTGASLKNFGLVESRKLLVMAGKVCVSDWRKSRRGESHFGQPEGTIAPMSERLHHRDTVGLAPRPNYWHCAFCMSQAD